jgi:hypothetical protein
MIGGDQVAVDARDLVIKYKLAIVLYDLSTNSVVSKSDFTISEKSYPQDVKNQMSNLVVNFLYRIPLDDFSKLMSRIRDSSLQHNLQKLSISGHGNVSDVLAFQKYLSDQSIKLRLKSQIFSINQDKTELVVFYQGNDTILAGHLTDLKEKSKNDGFEFKFLNNSGPFDIKLMPRLKRANNELPNKTIEEI